MKKIEIIKDKKIINNSILFIIENILIIISIIIGSKNVSAEANNTYIINNLPTSTCMNENIITNKCEITEEGNIIYYSKNFERRVTDYIFINSDIILDIEFNSTATNVQYHINYYDINLNYISTISYSSQDVPFTIEKIQNAQYIKIGYINDYRYKFTYIEDSSNMTPQITSMRYALLEITNSTQKLVRSVLNQNLILLIGIGFGLISISLYLIWKVIR